MKRGLILGALLSRTLLFSQTLSVDSLDKEEAFLVKRITEFWKDQDYNLVEKQIQSFMKRYPNSELNDYLKGILGDIYLKNHAYEKAIEVYTSILQPQIQEKVLVNALQAMYETNQYAALQQLGSTHLNSPEKFLERRDEFLFLMAEGYFRSSSKGDENYLQNLEQSKILFERLQKTNYNDPALFALAEIYKELSEPKKSAEIYKKLSERYKDKKEDLLFQAAVAESQFNPSLAIETFNQVIQIEGTHKYSSAFNRMILLFQMQAYDSIIESIDYVLQNATQETNDQVMYIYSRSLFGTQMYEKALEIVAKIDIKDSLSEAEKKNLFLIELGSLHQLKDLERYQKALKAFETAFPEDKELPKAIFVHALMLKDHLKTLEAQGELERILSAFQDFENADSLLLEYGLVTYDNEQYALSQKSLKSFIETYPKSEQLGTAFKYYLSSALQLFDMVQKGGDPSCDYSKIDLMQDLQWVLKASVGLSTKELQQTRFLEAQIGFDLGYVADSIHKLESYIKDYADHPTISDAHLLVALGYETLGADLDKFLEHAEKAVLINQNPDRVSQIHLQIFNSLLQYKNRLKDTKVALHSTTKKIEKIEQVAANHLYAAFECPNTVIRHENLLWLANHFYQGEIVETKLYEKLDRGTNTLSDNLDKSKKILQKILFNNQNNTSFDLAANPSLEKEMMRLIKIHGYEGNSLLHQSLLKIFTDAYQTANITTNLRQQALVELAKSYEDKQDFVNAASCFEKAAKLPLQERTIASEYAKIHAIRLHIDRFDSMDQDAIDDQISYLKGVQIEKAAATEPLHIEAALTYVQARKALADPFNQDMMELFFLNRVKEDYENIKDPQIAAYRASITANPQIKAQVESYLKLLSLEMLLTKSKLEANDGKFEESSIYKLEALKILSEMKKDKSNTHYIEMRLGQLTDMFD
jgi:outer membrane protein assembly factor BamD (BamD/ComL family)